MSRWRMKCLHWTTAIALAIFSSPVMADGEETFVTIHKVIGKQMLVTKDASGVGGGRGRGMRGAGANAQGRGRGRGFRAGASTANAVTLTVPVPAKITSAMRERRTFEFRVLAELPGGLQHQVFRNMAKPLQARILTKNNAIVEVNVITGETDINQSSATSAGQTVIAVRPKRPPTKRPPTKQKQ
ncbi:MAG: hypothetical protein AAF483_10280 [Planctomycetota bacterium]